MKASRKTVYATLGTLLTLAGAVGSYVIFLQPWTNCIGIDGRSASCTATPNGPGLQLGLALFVLIMGIVLLAMSISIRRKRIPSDAAGPFGKFK